MDFALFINTVIISEKIFYQKLNHKYWYYKYIAAKILREHQILIIK